LSVVLILSKFSVVQLKVL